MNRTKQWFLRTLAATMALLLLCSAVVFAADPFFYYRWDGDGEGVFFNQRYQSAGIARNCDADTVLLGTSMVSNFRASAIAETFGGTAAKITLPDGRFSEFDQVIETLFRHHTPERVLFSLDLNILVRDESALENELPQYLYDANPFNDVQYLLNKDALIYSVYSLYAKANGTALPCDEAFTWDRDTGFSMAFVLAGYQRAELSGETLAADAYRENVENNLAHLLSWAQEHPETEFIVYLPPYNILYWDKTARTGATEAVFAALEQCFETLGEVENIRLCEFLDLDMVIDCSYYNDYIHFSGLGATEVLAAMESGEYDVTKENRSEMLRAVREMAQNYDYEMLLGGEDPRYAVIAEESAAEEPAEEE